MSVGIVGTAGTGPLSGVFAPARSTAGSSRVDEATRQVRLDQQKVDETKADADKKAQAAQHATAELKSAKAAVAQDQAELNQAKRKANLDVYT